MRHRTYMLAVVAFLTLCSSAWAINHNRHERHKPRPRPTLSPQARHVRAGCPQLVRPHSQETYVESYSGGFVGGGASFGLGEPRTLEEGTWGRDYQGRFIPRHVWLNWWHGADSRGGYANYKTDGPKIFHHK